MDFTLTPGYYDVDRYGWELADDYRDITECHPTFHTDRTDDIRAAQAWADEIIGRPQTWERIDDRGHDGRYGHHYIAED
ncbi:hypothetical protein [Kitasatospora purpeofusca]|uniref:hypothetical protein n=1 Tax=Kitasatospora purpeofusca TaxID=67352 RepID=UPI003866FF89|nr:hypothetical protein OIP63_26950 [Kitasatospora purpeofusca]